MTGRQSSSRWRARSDETERSAYLAEEWDGKGGEEREKGKGRNKLREPENAPLPRRDASDKVSAQAGHASQLGEKSESRLEWNKRLTSPPDCRRQIDPSSADDDERVEAAATARAEPSRASEAPVQSIAKEAAAIQNPASNKPYAQQRRCEPKDEPLENRQVRAASPRQTSTLARAAANNRSNDHHRARNWQEQVART